MQRFAPGKLHHMDRQTGMADAQVEPFPAAGEFTARHHFGNHETRPMRISALAKRLVSDPGHRRQENTIAYSDPADNERRGELIWTGHAQKPSNVCLCLFTSQIGMIVQCRMNMHCGLFGKTLAFLFARD